MTISKTQNTTPLSVIARWSFSGLMTYERCPLAAKKKYLDKLPSKENEAMNRGLVMHKAAEQFIKGELTELPKELNRLSPVLSELQQAHTAGCVHVEENWGFDMGWKPVDFSAENVWTRGSLDALWVDSPISARGFDWKSGKRYPVKHIQQEQLYAVYSFEMFPSLEDFTFHFGYADEKSEYPNNMTARHYTRTAALKLKQGFHARGLRMTTDDEHKPRPSPVNCKWCDYKDSCEWAK